MSLPHPLHCSASPSGSTRTAPPPARAAPAPPPARLTLVVGYAVVESLVWDPSGVAPHASAVPSLAVVAEKERERGDGATEDGGEVSRGEEEGVGDGGGARRRRGRAGDRERRAGEGRRRRWRGKAGNRERRAGEGNEVDKGVRGGDGGDVVVAGERRGNEVDKVPEFFRNCIWVLGGGKSQIRQGTVHPRNW